MDTVTVNKERLVRFQRRLQQCIDDLSDGRPYPVEARMEKLVEEINDIITGQPSKVEEGDKHDR